MTPLSFEWHWNADHIIFMGLLYLALAVVLGGLAVVYIKSWLDVQGEEGQGAQAPELSHRSSYSKY